MNSPVPVVRLKNAWRSSHPWIFQKLVEKPAAKPKPGTIVDVVGVDGEWIGRGFYNGHSRIAVRILETDQSVPVDAGWFARKIAAAVSLRRDWLKLDGVSDAWRVVHSEGDGLSGLVVDRYGDLVVVEFFAAGMFRHREWIYDAARTVPGLPLPQLCRRTRAEAGKLRLPQQHHHRSGGDHRARHQVPRRPGRCAQDRLLRRSARQPSVAERAGRRQDRAGPVLQHRRLCGVCRARGASEVLGVDIDEDVIAIAKGNAKLNNVRPKFVQADIFPWLRDASNRGEQFDVVILDPAKMTRDREQVIPALKKYLDMNKLALGVVKPGGLFATFSCTGLVAEQEFLDMLRRASYFSGRTIQILKVAGAGPDHPFMAHVQESRYLKAVFCRVV